MNASPKSARHLVAALRSHLPQPYRCSRTYATLQTLIDEGFATLPYPGAGATRARWQVLAALAADDLCLAKLYARHADALALLNELEGPLRSSRAGMRAVGCSESAQTRVTLTPRNRPDREVILRGTKAWCAGARHVRAAPVSAWDSDTPCLVEIEPAQAHIDVCPAHWHAVGMAHTQSFTVRFLGAHGASVPRAPICRGPASPTWCAKPCCIAPAIPTRWRT
ncbi:hypothetical protein [Pandoraea sputorum]|uniref:Acyl-CoA dehydrogenase n=1 Tax=Pandoraea sputorum TaxID=93222 RepID=A0A5E5BJE3_9BURK|nr:hypothetical protein [Pandoraea sputorum]VVE84663.1 hypothetical protein PSP31121_04864 [Pandoraea sputorum]